MKQKCSACGNSLECTKNSSCWCTGFPPILSVETDATCLCAVCLKAKIQERIAVLTTDVDPDNLAFVASLGEPKHLQEDIDYTYSNEGLMIFTKWYLMRRGHCCESGCACCPYGYEK